MNVAGNDARSTLSSHEKTTQFVPDQASAKTWERDGSYMRMGVAEHVLSLVINSKLPPSSEICA